MLARVIVRGTQCSAHATLAASEWDFWNCAVACDTAHDRSVVAFEPVDYMLNDLTQGPPIRCSGSYARQSTKFSGTPGLE